MSSHRCSSFYRSRGLQLLLGSCTASTTRIKDTEERYQAWNEKSANGDHGNCDESCWSRVLQIGQLRGWIGKTRNRHPMEYQ
jgi:hypothetical protein